MTDDKPDSQETETTTPAKDEAKAASDDKVTEIGGPKGPEPTRFGDWEQKGRCTDF